jgi:hypothetical protein
VPISLVFAGTSLSDPSGAAIPIATNDGAVNIVNTAVPEPSGLILAATACGTWLLAWGFRRVRQPRGR